MQKKKEKENKSLKPLTGFIAEEWSMEICFGLLVKQTEAYPLGVEFTKIWPFLIKEKKLSF